MKKLKNNLSLKIISLIAAFFLWSYVVAGVNPTQKMTVSNIPVKIVNKEKLAQRDLEVMTIEPEKTYASLSGKRQALGTIRPEDIQASVDVEGLQEGLHSLPISFDLPNNVLLNPDATAGRVNIQIEKIIDQSLPVRVDTTGEVEENFVVEKITASPNKIPCTGARSRIDRVKGLRAFIDISSLSADSTISAKVVPVDEEGQEVEGVDLSLSEVKVSILVSKQKLLPIEATLEGKSPEGYRIEEVKVDPHEILVKGVPDLIDQLTGLKSKPLEREKITRSGLYPLKPDLPAGINLVDENQSISADITVETKETRSLTVPLDKVTYPGLPDNLKAETQEKTVQVTLEGYPKDLNQLDDQSLPLVIPIASANRLTGSTSLNLPVQLTLPGEIMVKDIQPKTVQVHIKKK